MSFSKISKVTPLPQNLNPDFLEMQDELSHLKEMVNNTTILVRQSQANMNIYHKYKLVAQLLENFTPGMPHDKLINLQKRILQIFPLYQNDPVLSRTAAKKFLAHANESKNSTPEHLRLYTLTAYSVRKLFPDDISPAILKDAALNDVENVKAIMRSGLSAKFTNEDMIDIYVKHQNDPSFIKMIKERPPVEAFRLEFILPQHPKNARLIYDNPILKALIPVVDAKLFSNSVNASQDLKNNNIARVNIPYNLEYAVKRLQKYNVNPYIVLGLTKDMKDTTDDELKTIFTEIARLYLPPPGEVLIPSGREAERFNILSASYRVLLDPEARKLFPFSPKPTIIPK